MTAIGEGGRFDGAGLRRFGETAARQVDDGAVTGLVALVARGEAVHVEAHGSLSVDGPAVRRDSLFRIASMTKPITGAATMALVDEGLIRLGAPVGDLLPELASPRVLAKVDGPLDDTVSAARAITPRDLLTFTFGFGMCMEMFASPEPWPVVTAADALQIGLGPPDPLGPPEPDAWIARLGSLPLLAQPGDRWLYHTGAQVLGVLCARAAGMSFPEVLRTRVFDRLGMGDTAMWTAQPDRLATAYRPTDGGLEVWDPPDGKWSGAPAFPDGGAGLVSTVDDLCAFARAFLRGGVPILSARSVAAMCRDQLSDRQRASTRGFLEGRSWALCQLVLTEDPRAGAFGWDGGLGTSWLVDPVRDLVVVVLTQRLFESPQLPALHVDLQAAAYGALTSS